jgi:hypothetical protein
MRPVWMKHYQCFMASTASVSPWVSLEAVEAFSKPQPHAALLENWNFFTLSGRLPSAKIFPLTVDGSREILLPSIIAGKRSSREEASSKMQ